MKRSASEMDINIWGSVHEIFTVFYYPLEVSSMKYCRLGVFRKEYGVRGSRNSRQFMHRVTVFTANTNITAGPVLALESMGAKRYFRCHSLNIALKYKQ